MAKQQRETKAEVDRLRNIPPDAACRQRPEGGGKSQWAKAYDWAGYLKAGAFGRHAIQPPPFPYTEVPS